jgi:AhpC/TSA family
LGGAALSCSLDNRGSRHAGGSEPTPSVLPCVGAVRSYARALHVSYPIGLDESGDVSVRYDVAGLPTTFLIDQEGIIQSMKPGAIETTYLRTTADAFFATR